MPLLHSRSFASFTGLSETTRVRSKTPDKPLPITPDPSTSSCLSPIEDDDREADAESTASSLLHAPVTVTKRTHALLELLSSERAYASDLALIRDIHIPLALGQPAPFQASSVSPPTSSSSSSRTLSTASDSSSGSSNAVPPVPPMTREDSRIIFTNVSEIAVFADTFSEQLEEALGAALDGGTGEDHVGALFLETIPTLEPLYKAYITKHPSALEHLNNLPQTRALIAYLAHTRTLASSLTHAWDLPSLLIKPVQRLLKYSLLLGAIIDETPDSHGDKTNLKLAREKMEEVARDVNEGQRRREVVKEVLTGVASGSPTKKGSEPKPKKKGLNLGVATSVSLGRMKSLRSSSQKTKEGAEANQEAEQVVQMGEELKRYEVFIQKLAKETVDWTASVRGVMQHLFEWAECFGRIIWMSRDIKSEAFDAFITVISSQLLPTCNDLAGVIKNKLLRQLSALMDTTLAPFRLLEAMHTLEPLHYGLLNLNVSKSRPPPQLLEASQSYVALRAQLFAELPQYIALLNKGMTHCILQLANWQAMFWRDVRDRWAELWDALKAEGEMNAGAAETVSVWWNRFAQVEGAVGGLNIVRPPRRQATPEKRKDRPRSLEMWSESGSTVVVSSVLSALEPIHIPHSPSHNSFAASPASMKSRSTHSIDLGRRQLERRPSNESLRSKKSGKSTRSLKLTPEIAPDEANYVYGASTVSLHKPAYSRTRSMPISSPTALKKSTSHGRIIDTLESTSVSASSSLHNVTSTIYSVTETLLDDDRGRPSRKPSFRRRLTDTLRPSPASSINSRHRRSPSLPVISVTNISPSPSPKAATFTNGSKAPAMYSCRVVHPCLPPPGISYKGLPFFTLREDDEFEVLREAGHPSTHPELPLYVDDGEDCLLLVRLRTGDIGWALASFLVPVD
ncbi:hypothetical protein BKA93DRAFT_731664 [Sparassis latifolia]